MPLIAVTGAQGFIGSNLIRALHQQGVQRILAVDMPSVEHGHLHQIPGIELCETHEFLLGLKTQRWPEMDTIFHQGACSDTLLQDQDYMTQVNFEFTKDILHACRALNIRLIYASSASVYGTHSVCHELPDCEKPLNIYAQSKLAIDNHVRENGFLTQGPQVVGLRYFNVYGPNESHKGRMASMVWQLQQQWLQHQQLQLFGAHDNCPAGGQARDFIHVLDVIATNLWFFQHAEHSGIFNLGTGKSRTFNELAVSVLRAQNALGKHEGLEDALRKNWIRYIPFPITLRGKYQNHTCAELASLQRIACPIPTIELETGVNLLQ